jgi:hypothetical protein
MTALTQQKSRSTSGMVLSPPLDACGIAGNIARVGAGCAIRIRAA